MRPLKLNSAIFIFLLHYFFSSKKSLIFVVSKRVTLVIPFLKRPVLEKMGRKKGNHFQSSAWTCNELRHCLIFELWVEEHYLVGKQNHYPDYFFTEIDIVLYCTFFLLLWVMNSYKPAANPVKIKKTKLVLIFCAMNDCKLKKSFNIHLSNTSSKKIRIIYSF